jgi:hypothetical protein
MPQAERRSTTRRALFAAAPLLAAGAAAPAQAAHTGDDAELLELGRQHAASSARYDALDEQAMRAQEAACALSPKPDAIRIRAADRPIVDIGYNGRFVGDFMHPDDIRRWRINSDMTFILWPRRAREELLARRAEVLAAWEQWERASDAAHVACGVRAIEERLDDEGQTITALEHRILDTPAKTPAGWRLKARIARKVLDPEPDGTYEDMVVRSLLADLA